jgi:hypothetical protein
MLANSPAERLAMSAIYVDAEARRRTVLVVVLNNEADLAHAANAGWYRIPSDGRRAALALTI